MQTPRKLSLEQFATMRTEWIAQNCEPDPVDGAIQICKKCKTPVEIIGAYMSVHDPRFPECAGSGRVMRLVIPFCPKCEQKPIDEGCIHELEPHWDGSRHLPTKNFRGNSLN